MDNLSVVLHFLDAVLLHLVQAEHEEVSFALGRDELASGFDARLASAAHAIQRSERLKCVTTGFHDRIPDLERVVRRRREHLGVAELDDARYLVLVRLMTREEVGFLHEDLAGNHMLFTRLGPDLLKLRRGSRYT